MKRILAPVEPGCSLSLSLDSQQSKPTCAIAASAGARTRPPASRTQHEALALFTSSIREGGGHPARSRPRRARPHRPASPAWPCRDTAGPPSRLPARAVRQWHIAVLQRFVERRPERLSPLRRQNRRAGCRSPASRQTSNHLAIGRIGFVLQNMAIMAPAVQTLRGELADLQLPARLSACPRKRNCYVQQPPIRQQTAAR